MSLHDRKIAPVLAFKNHEHCCSKLAGSTSRNRSCVGRALVARCEGDMTFAVGILYRIQYKKQPTFPFSRVLYLAY